MCTVKQYHMFETVCCEPGSTTRICVLSSLVYYIYQYDATSGPLEVHPMTRIFTPSACIYRKTHGKRDPSPP